MTEPVTLYRWTGRDRFRVPCEEWTDDFHPPWDDDEYVPVCVEGRWLPAAEFDAREAEVERLKVRLALTEAVVEAARVDQLDHPYDPPCDCQTCRAIATYDAARKEG